jgi:hypothetical protein
MGLSDQEAIIQQIFCQLVKKITKNLIYMHYPRRTIRIWQIV